MVCGIVIYASWHKRQSMGAGWGGSGTVGDMQDFIAIRMCVAYRGLREQWYKFSFVLNLLFYLLI